MVSWHPMVDIRWQCSILLLLIFTLPAVSIISFCPPMRKTIIINNVHYQLQTNDNDTGDSDDSDRSFGLYIHIPYCRRRCNYCDFAITPIGSNHHDNEDIKTAGFRKLDAKYKAAVLHEIDAIKQSSIQQKDIRLRSIYFGGGTPSLAPLSTLQSIMDSITKSENGILFSLIDDAEITIEMDPGTFDLPYLMAVKEMGFNRISLGVQSFDDNLLTTMGRVHRSTDVYSSIEMIRHVYGDHANYSIDLISGIPGLTLAGWADTLYKAVRLRPRPKHMSLYDLQLEKGTSFGKWYKNAADGVDDAHDVVIIENCSAHPALPSAEDCAFMYSYASGYLRSKNYEHYEISSYAYTTSDEKVYRSRHNQIYWEYSGRWYAAGMGSTSNLNGVRFARPRALSDYILWTDSLNMVQSDAANDKLPPWMSLDAKLADPDDDLLDVIMTRLRTLEGLNLDWVAEHESYGETYANAILRGFQLALDLDLGCRMDNGTYGFIKLSDPKGFLFSNNIISNIFLSLSEL